MKAKDLKDRSTADLVELQTSLSKDLFSYRMKNCTNQLDDTSLLSKVRKDIARINQILHTRALAEAASQKGSES